MTTRFWSLILVVALLASLMVYQATQVSSARVYLPNDLLANPKTELRRIRVGGRVADKEVKYSVEPRIELRFHLIDPETKDSDMIQATVPVVYRGLRPDMFAPGRDVIIDGHFRNGTLEATSLLTQCPSKYEPPTPEGTMQQGEMNG